MERFGALVVGGLGVAAVGLHALLEPASMLLLGVHLLAWLLATAVTLHLTRQIGIISGAVRRARAAIDLLDDAVVVVDAGHHRIVYANQEAARLAGRLVTAVIGMRLFDAGPWPQVEELMGLVDGDREFAMTERADRRYRIAATRVVWEGERAYVVRARDITDKELAQRDLAVRERRFRTLAENVAGVVYRLRVHPEFELEFVNDHLRTVLGYQPTEWFLDPGMLARIARPAHRASVDLEGAEHVYGSDGVHSYEVQHADGQWLWVEDHHTTEHDQEGRLVAVQGIIFDITAKWETEQQLGEALRKHEVAAETMHRTARVEQTLLQSVSHELRTPMTAALGFARMLAKQPEAMNPAQQEKLLERLVVNIERIEGLVNRMLEFDRFSRGEGRISRSLERLDEVAQSAIERVDLEGRTLTSDLQLVMALVDRRRIEHAVEALLDNAVLHTAPGTTVRVAVTGSGDTARIVVEDDGPGVDPVVAEHVFAPFTQGPASKDIANPGVGLGLAMVQVSARLHGGDVRHEPVRPHGARFVIELPVAAGQEPANGDVRGAGLAPPFDTVQAATRRD